jgi:hypothetical protein
MPLPSLTHITIVDVNDIGRCILAKSRSISDIKNSYKLNSVVGTLYIVS